MSTRSSHHLPLISRSGSGEYRCCAWQHGLRLYFPNESEIVGWSPLAPVPPEFRPSFRFDRVGDRWGFGAGVRYQLMLRSRSLVRALLTSTVAAAIALAGCTSDGTPASTENSGSIGSFVRNLFGIKSEDQAAVAHNEASAEPPAPKTKPATSKPKAHAKREQEAPRATAPGKGDKPAVQEQAADSMSQKPAEAAPTVVPSSREDQPLNAQSRNENLVRTAAAAWPIIPNTEGTGAGGAAADTTEAANANAVQLVDPNEVNELDRAAETAQAESSWSTYLLLLLGAALAAASALWFFLRMASIFARRATNSRLHMSNP